MTKSLLHKGVVAQEGLDKNWDRWTVYQTNGALKITEFAELKEGESWKPPQEVVLQSWDEIVRLRDFLNSLHPMVVQQDEGGNMHERSIA